MVLGFPLWGGDEPVAVWKESDKARPSNITSHSVREKRERELLLFRESPPGGRAAGAVWIGAGHLTRRYSDRYEEVVDSLARICIQNAG